MNRHKALETAGEGCAPPPSENWRDQVAAVFGRCGKPVIYADERVIASDTGAAVRRPAENLECPITLSPMRRGAVDARRDSPDAIVIDIVGDVNCIGSGVVITEQLANEVAERHTRVEG